MRYALSSLVLFLSGCGFLEYATRPGPSGKTPLEEAGDDLAGGLSGFETGGVVAGVVALAFTTLKTGMRLYQGYKASKTAVPHG
jgi:hypothetical protein